MHPSLQEREHHSNRECLIIRHPGFRRNDEKQNI